MRRLIINVMQKLRKWWMRQRLSTRTLPQYIWRAFRNFSKDGTTQAASLAYYAVFSIFPLLLLLAVGINSLLGTTVAHEQIAQALKIFLPRQTVEVLQENLTETLLQQGNTFQILAVVGLVWSALGLFSNLTQSLDVIFKVSASRSMWRQRVLAFTMTLVLVALVISSFITSGAMRLIAAFFFDQPNAWVSIATFFLPFGINLVIFILLFRYVPMRLVYWEAIWPSAIFGAAGWEFAKAGFAWYVDHLANFQVVYGSITTAIILLLSAYIIASIFLLSAELCARLNEWVEAHPQGQQIIITPATFTPTMRHHQDDDEF